ncbi:hypothetical protein AVEN_206506-1 [Araneus ventricosus]|uniref:Uncharacterized protein n=1 Tax=Araneus ventricosus TaxID=182803 RepID=A0A4Y2QIP0_ARAVE|nr:hypothetical protein AVEN_206506-1 [Araneus ventricosus]
MDEARVKNPLAATEKCEPLTSCVDGMSPVAVSVSSFTSGAASAEERKGRVSRQASKVTQKNNCTCEKYFNCYQIHSMPINDSSFLEASVGWRITERVFMTR